MVFIAEHQSLYLFLSAFALGVGAVVPKQLLVLLLQGSGQLQHELVLKVVLLCIGPHSSDVGMNLRGFVVPVAPQLFFNCPQVDRTGDCLVVVRGSIFLLVNGPHEGLNVFALLQPLQDCQLTTEFAFNLFCSLLFGQANWLHLVFLLSGIL